MKIKTKFDVGDLVEDVVTGFQGVVLNVSYYATGCTHYGLCSREVSKEGGDKWTFLDESRLKLVESRVLQSLQKEEETVEPSERTGGPSPNPPQM